jgi:hypothetical protein
MDFLASDALRGRGSGTHDELVAATYVASALSQYGIAPAGDNGGYIQRAVTVRQVLAAPPTMHFLTPGDGIPAQTIVWTHGKEMLVEQISETEFRGRLKRITLRAEPALTEAALRTPVAAQEQAGQPPALGSGEEFGKDAVVLISGEGAERIRETAISILTAGALAVLVPASPETLRDWNDKGNQLPKLPARIEGESGVGLGSGFNLFALGEQALIDLRGIPDGTYMYLETKPGPPEVGSTWNAVGKITGCDPALGQSAILLSAHLDHLGVGEPVHGDSIYNGADDDASGTTAVLEMARVLGSGRKPRHTVIFALFGSEETGGLGSMWFLAHPPVPLSQLAANLEFEMIGRRDPKQADDTLWLTGWDRTNLGPALAAHGARLVPDSRPEQHFFMRSDNYLLAKKGVVAQTISSFGLHADYHKPTDDLAHIDFKHMTVAIGSLIAPVEWLVNSSFRPVWKQGGKP